MPDEQGAAMTGWLARLFGGGHFARLDGAGLPRFEKGSVWLVGAGPGAPGLISVLGYHALGQADVIVHDALVHPDLLAFARRGAVREFAGKRAGRPSPTQDQINRRLIELARAGKRVLRLKGGDPFVFGRGGEEAVALGAAGIAFRIVPGISSGAGGLAYAGIPLTHRGANHAVTFVTGHDEKGALPEIDWDALARSSPVIVLFMATRHLPEIAERLLAAGRAGDEKVAIASSLTRPEQAVIETDLGHIDTLGEIATPAIVVIGPVTGYRAVLDWYAGALRENRYG